MELEDLSEAERFLVVLLARKKYVRTRRIHYQRLQGYRGLSNVMARNERFGDMLAKLYKLDLINFSKQGKDWWVSLTVDLGLPLAVHLSGFVSRGGRIRMDEE